ncbi:helix-turn-helix domain-containing protein, partial [Klebsiella pneumoniae]
LAERAGISVDMVSKIEVGATGARFPMIERLAEALSIDPAELFTTEVSGGRLRDERFSAITTQLARLPNHDLIWIQG